MVPPGGGEVVAGEGTTVSAVIEAVPAEVDIEGCLTDGGLTPADVDAPRRRLLAA